MQVCSARPWGEYKALNNTISTEVVIAAMPQDHATLPLPHYQTYTLQPLHDQFRGRLVPFSTSMFMEKDSGRHYNSQLFLPLRHTASPTCFLKPQEIDKTLAGALTNLQCGFSWYGYGD